MIWQEIPGTEICAALSVSGDFVISHRPGDFNASWRPKGRHVHVVSMPTLEEAKAACESWSAKGCPVDDPVAHLPEYARKMAARFPPLTEFASGFPRWWKP